MANQAVFEDYFRRADVDRDGRISGAEAVSFFKGAGLQQATLAKIWQFADQGHTGFLSRPAFFNALKLVTVAQSGRDLTPDIVQAALSNPLVAGQIPAPRIAGLTAQPVPNQGPSSAPAAPQRAGPSTLPDQSSSGSGVPPRPWPVPTQPSSLAANNSGAPPAIPRPGSAPAQKPAAGTSADTWPSIRSSSGVPTPQVNSNPASNQQAGPSTSASGTAAAKPGSGALTSASLVDAFGSDPFAAAPKSSGLPTQTKSLPSSAASQGFADFGDGGFRAEPLGGGTAPTSTSSRDASKDVKPPVPLPRAGTVPAYAPPQPSGLGPGAPWPRITPSDTQRYTRVFTDVDTDRDGKITGEQARDLFLSWRLPRDVLKQVWDLSDQDGDAMLSFREFCVALYLMERYREGRPLPPVLPSGVFGDERQPNSYASLGPGQARGLMPNSVPGYGAPSTAGIPQHLTSEASANNRPFAPATADRPATSQAPNAPSDPTQPPPYKSKAPVLEMHLVNQLSRDEQDTLKSRHKDAEVADKKAYEVDKEILDYRQKAELYRTKLQEIILFKSRCENKLGEITERAAADKREMESLAKKYDERFKAAGESNSRLRAEEAAFRDIQERKIELYNAIAKMEQGGDANDLLQSKADRISHDLDELKKALNERSRRLGLTVKSTVPTEKQFGWQPGIQERAVEWDEEWDKFDDEGFVSLQDMMDDATGANSSASARKPTTSLDDGAPQTNNFDSPRPTVEVSKAIPSSDAMPNHDSPRADSEESGRSGFNSPSTSTSVDRSATDKPVNTNKASQRYANLTESQEDVFNGPPSYSSTSNSDVFGDGTWSAAFSHDDEVDSGVRASWGLQSNPPSTQASFDVAGSRTSRFGRADSSSLHGPGDSMDMGSLHVSSPGRGTDVPSPTLSHRGNGNFRDSDDFDRFGSLGSSKDFDRSPRVSGSFPNAHMGSAFFDSPRKSNVGNDRSYARFDSFSSPVNSPTFPRFGDEHQDHGLMGTGKDQDRSFTRFDSFNSTKGDGGAQGRPSNFGAFDDGDDFFANSTPFTAGANEKKSDQGWSAF